MLENLGFKEEITTIEYIFFEDATIITTYKKINIIFKILKRII